MTTPLNLPVGGNFMVTLKNGGTCTTVNIAYNADQTTIQSAINVAINVATAKKERKKMTNKNVAVKVAKELKRNAAVLNELRDATEYRIAYKTPDGWKRLYLPEPARDIVKRGAVGIVQERLDTLVPIAFEITVDRILNEAANDLVDDVEIALRGV